MTESKASAATQKPAAKAAATKSAAEGENLPGASAPAVTSEAEATRSDTTLTAGEVDKVSKDAGKGEFGPFQDTATPVGSALEATTEPDAIDLTLDFEDETSFTETAGDVFAAKRSHFGRNIVEVGIQGWTGPGFTFAPYQAKLLHEALGKLLKKGGFKTHKG